MFLSKIISRIQPRRQCIYLVQTQLVQRVYSNKSDSQFEKHNQVKNNNDQKLGDMSSKYQVFRNEDSEVILDIYEESNKYGDLLEQDKEEIKDSFEGIYLTRGCEGVYDIEDLVDVLRRENAQDIFVASVPKEIKYVNYICVVTGKSYKHMQAIAQFVRRVYKKKMHKRDLIPRIEGSDSKDWMALDLGNIALHIFSPTARVLYDLDSLWSVGPQYDAECNKQDPVAEMLEKHSVYLKDLQPASVYGVYLFLSVLIKLISPVILFSCESFFLKHHNNVARSGCIIQK